MTLQQKIEWLQTWLRYHGDYSIKISLWDLFGTVALDIDYLGKPVYLRRGKHFEKRLDEAIAYCQLVSPAPVPFVGE